jgi:hypothetical protein
VTYRTIELRGMKVLLLHGMPDSGNSKTGEIEAVDKLLEAANQNPDAVAFGYLAGKWVAAA